MGSGLGCTALACGTGLLVTVERRAAPTNETRNFLGRAPLGAGILGDREFVRDDRRVRQRPAEACAVLACCGDTRDDSLDDELALTPGCEDVRHHRCWIL